LNYFYYKMSKNCNRKPKMTAFLFFFSLQSVPKQPQKLTIRTFKRLEPFVLEKSLEQQDNKSEI